MSARLMVLGIVSQKKETHGYDVYREIASWQAETWSKVRSGSIYHAFAQLEKKGLLARKGIEKSKDGPSQTRYIITRQGEVELLQLVKASLVSLDQEQFTAGLAFMHLISRKEAVQLALDRLELYQQICSFMNALPQENHPRTPATHPEIITSWSVLFEATLSWQKQFIDRLRAGGYAFADEQVDSPRLS
jgi:DNA-binding PadR family transcriptional regulator